MARIENVELTTLCLVRDGDNYLLQNRLKSDWAGFSLPGGHIEAGESIVESVIREVKEETGLTIYNPKLCGIKQFPIENGRYLVFLFVADEFDGNIVSSSEGKMYWINKNQLDNYNLVPDFHELLKVMLDDNLNEFQYVVENNIWKALLK